MIAIIGCGNPLMGDDGFGLHVLGELEHRPLPGNVMKVDAGTSGLDILDHIEGVEKLIVIDAVKSGNEPGTIYRLTEEDLVSPNPNLLSLHELRLEHTLDMGRRILGEKFPKQTVLLGVEVERVQAGLELSPRVREAVPRVLDPLKEIQRG